MLQAKAYRNPHSGRGRPKSQQQNVKNAPCWQWRRRENPLFSDRLEETKETSCSFFNNFWSLVDLSVGFEPRWSSDHLSEKKERMDLVGFPRNSSISSGSRWLFIRFSRSVNSRDIEEYPERHLGNRSDSISVRSVWRKEGSQRIDLSFSCWISLWLINVWYSESSLLMESKRSLDWSEDPFNWRESVTWTKLDLVESYWIFDYTPYFAKKSIPVYQLYIV